MGKSKIRIGIAASLALLGLSSCFGSHQGQAPDRDVITENDVQTISIKEMELQRNPDQCVLALEDALWALKAIEVPAEIPGDEVNAFARRSLMEMESRRLASVHQCDKRMRTRCESMVSREIEGRSPAEAWKEEFGSCGAAFQKPVTSDQIDCLCDEGRVEELTRSCHSENSLARQIANKRGFCDRLKAQGKF